MIPIGIFFRKKSGVISIPLSINIFKTNINYKVKVWTPDGL